MLRDFSYWNIYLNELMSDDYGQERDMGHTHLTRMVMEKWISKIDAKTVLDIGCGANCVAEPFFSLFGMKYTGIAFGMDAKKAKGHGKNVEEMDMSFLNFNNNSFDLLWARHVLEHSTSPLLTLMEWNRVSNHLLCVILPTPEVYGKTGLNHYSVLDDEQWKFLFERSGWHIIWKDDTEKSEFRYMLEKKERKK